MKSFYLIFTFMVIGSELIVAQPTNSRNYIENTILTKTGVKSIDEAIRLPDYHKRIKISYFDGLGRPIQEILFKASGTNKDIVLAIGYDAIGRKSKEFLAYAASDNKFGLYRTNALNSNYVSSDQYNFYQNNNEASIPTMPNPFNETVFEASPENKIIEKGFPGNSWAINNSNKHTIQMSYDFNTLNEVKYWTINTNGINAASSYYEANTLYKIQTTDENGNLIIEYKDKEGLVVCKKVQDSINSFAITQYVYDDFNLLRYVIPPNAAHISTISETDTTIFMKYIYGYKYDNRNRLIAKKIPGKSDWEELLYNKIDKLVLSRDPQQKAEGYWIFNKYDQLGRLIITGKFITNQSIQLLQTLIDSDSIFYENRDKNYSEVNTNLNQTGYTNNAQPKVNNTDSSSWLINYYDDYSFLQIPNVKKNIPLKYFSVPSSQTNNQTNNVHGLLTGTRVQVLGSLQYGNNIGGQNVAVLSPAKMLTSMLKYDIFGKLTYQIKQNYLSGVDMYKNYYNFAGELITTMRKTYYNDFKDSLVLQSSINYDLQGRKTGSTVQVNNNNPITTDSLQYNELGQLKNKSLHRQNNNVLENIVYTYNPRGWQLSAIGTNFSFRLGYDNPIQDATPQYNGNISWQEWGIANNLSSNYKYVYDKLNRLTNGLHSNNIHNETNIKYDKVGNIKTLTRQGVQQNYVYNGNRLERLESNTIKNYTYNRNGSMVSDGEVTIKYYENGMPKEISKGSDLTYYVYDALGTKLFSNYLKDSTQFYVDGIEFRGRRNPKPYYIAFEDGYIDSSLQFNYYLKDHLGNIRKVINATSGTVTQSTDYYPFGLAINTTGSSNNKYLYNGKEIQSGSGFYDFEARMYDAGVGRWFVVDPLAEEYVTINGYVYCANNPIKFIDPDGKEPWPVKSTFNGQSFHVDSWFGKRNTGLSYASNYHKGLDINFGSGRFDYGAPVFTTHTGVATVDNDPNGNSGRSVIITSPDKKFRTKYFHLKEININDGARVTEASQIGEIGGSRAGEEFGGQVHLHYEIEKYNPESESWVTFNPTEGKENNKNNVVDPQKWIKSENIEKSIKPIKLEPPNLTAKQDNTRIDKTIIKNKIL